MQSETHRCDICDIAFVNSGELVQHKIVVHIDEMYQSCNKFFANKQQLEKHAIEVHDNKSIK